jgi:hypothetical protein
MLAPNSRCLPLVNPARSVEVAIVLATLNAEAVPEQNQRPMPQPCRWRYRRIPAAISLASWGAQFQDHRKSILSALMTAYLPSPRPMRPRSRSRFEFATQCNTFRNHSICGTWSEIQSRRATTERAALDQNPCHQFLLCLQQMTSGSIQSRCICLVCGAVTSAKPERG